MDRPMTEAEEKRYTACIPRWEDIALDVRKIMTRWIRYQNAYHRDDR